MFDISFIVPHKLSSLKGKGNKLVNVLAEVHTPNKEYVFTTSIDAQGFEQANARLDYSIHGKLCTLQSIIQK